MPLRFKTKGNSDDISTLVEQYAGSVDISLKKKSGWYVFRAMGKDSQAGQPEDIL